MSTKEIIHTLQHIPVQLPEKHTYARLGYRFAKTNMTAQQREQIEGSMQEGFVLCEPRGAWTRIPIADRKKSSITLASGVCFHSSSLAKLLAKSHAVLLMAATVGRIIMQAIESKIQQEDGATALIFDAVGGETTDAALDWINAYVRRNLSRGCETLTSHRFSPGYGDLGLENQKIVYDILELAKLNIEITDRYMLIPEKSVIGIAGIEKIC
jgi:hypothetical protein